MNCLKCGRETDQTFCAECRAVMEKYPVKPGTILQLPKARAAKRPQPRKQKMSPETRIRRQQKIIQRLWIVIAVMLLVIGALGCTVYRLLEKGKSRPLGQNYSTIQTSEPTEAADADTPK